MMRETRSRGSISAMVVCLVMAAVSLVGLVHDGGQIVSTYVALSDVAQNAARLGGQQIVGIRDGNPHVDSDKAASVMRAYLSARGVTGVFSVRGTRVMVQVSGSVPMQVLGLIGIGERSIRVTRVVDVVEG